MNKICRYLLLTSAASALFLAGCGKEETAAEVPAKPASEASQAREQDFMKDPEFRAKLRDERLTGDKLRVQQGMIVKRLEARTNQLRAAHPNATVEETTALLEADAEWCSLRRRLEDVVTAVRDSERRQLKNVREKAADQQPL